MTGRPLDPQHRALMARFSAATMPSGLPSASTILEACARGMALATVTEPLVTFDYTATGLRSERWRPVVSQLRGLVVDATDGSTPIRAWPSPIITDLWPDSVIPPDRVPVVQEKLDGVLIARFRADGQWRWAGREGLVPDMEAIAQHWWTESRLTDDIVDQDQVLYLELCDPRLPTPTHAAEPGLYLLDVIDRRDGDILPLSRLTALAEEAGLRTPAMRGWTGSLQSYSEELKVAGPEVEGFVFRWGRRIRGRLVNEKYTLLANLLSTRSLGAIVDLWLSGLGTELTQDRLPDDLTALVAAVLADLDATLDQLRTTRPETPPTAAAHVLLAAAGGPEWAWPTQEADRG
ncbi:RNA ligase family protein [Micromonospora sp. NPDC003197]